MVEVFGVMVGRLGGVLARKEAVWEGELGEVNERLRGVGMEGILLRGVGVSASVGEGGLGGWMLN